MPKTSKLQVEFTRRTVISDARYDVLIVKIARIYQDVAVELSENETIIDVALTKFARISSQVAAKSAREHATLFLLPQDSIEIAKAKTLVWLTHDPREVDRWERACDALDASWNADELLPTPQETPQGEA